MQAPPLSTSDADAPGPPVRLLAAGAGLGAASLYYAQPLLGAVAADLHTSPAVIGVVPTATQVGYALGILFLAPLGDRHDRRRIILAKAAALSLALFAAAFAPALPALLVASFVVGVTATLAQDVVPATAVMATPERRGQVVGAVMTGLLLGILLSRVASGVLGQRWGWRSVYLVAALAVAAVGVALGRGLPSIAPTTDLRYGALLASMATLWRRHGALRRAVLAQGLLSIAFSAFWSTLALMLQTRFSLGSAAAGAFGLAGAAGALAAPLAGRLSDRRGTGWVTRAGASITVLSFAAMALDGALPPTARLALLIGTAITFDFGVQASLVGHQTLVYSLEPPARSRLNALLLTGMFIGMASGATLGSLALARAGWIGVVALGTLASLAAWIVGRASRGSDGPSARSA